MSLPQHLLYGVGGTVFIDLQSRPSNALVSIVDGDGVAIVTSQAANVSTINTVLAAAASRGSKSITVSSNAGIVHDSTFWLQDDPEDVQVSRVSGGTVTLRRPLLFDHVNNATVEGTRVSFPVNSACAATLFFDGRCEWNIDGNLAHISSVECTKYPMDLATFTLQDLYDEEPKFYTLVDDEFDLGRAQALARQDVLSRIAAIAPDQRARVHAAGPEFSQAAVFAAMARIYRGQHGGDAEVLFKRYESAFDSEISRIVGLLPRDADQDGVPEEDERIAGKSRRISR